MRKAKQWIIQQAKQASSFCERIAIETERHDGFYIEYVNSRRVFVEFVSRPRVRRPS